MIVTIASRNAELKDAFRDRVGKKLGKFDRFFDEDAQARVLVTAEGGRQTVEITIRDKGMVFRSEETSRELAASLDAAIDGMMRQIGKNKARLEKRMRAGAFDGLPGGEEQMPDYQVVKVKHFDVKPMSVEEAILQMNLSGHEFYAFLNEQTETVSVVYRRREGGYGVLEPEA